MCNRYLLLLLSLLCLLTLPVSADWLPEEDPIGETLVIEGDSNIIKDRLDEETENEENRYEPDVPLILNVTREAYFDRFVLPFLLLFGGGIALLLLTEAIRQLPKKTE